MRNLQQEYASFFTELETINRLESEERARERQFGQLMSDAEGQIRGRFLKQFQKLDEDIAQTRHFLDTAKHYTQMKDGVGRIAPPNFAYMRELDLKINDRSSTDPNATELVRVCNGAYRYLSQQRSMLEKEEKNALNQYCQSKTQAREREKAAAEKQIRDLYERLLRDGRLRSFASEIKAQSAAFFVEPQKTYELSVPTRDNALLKFGVISRPFPISEPYRREMQQMFAAFYDPVGNTLRIPLGVWMDAPIKMRLLYPNSEQDRVRVILNGLLFNILRNRAPLPNRVFFLDPFTRNPSALGAMEPLAGDPAFLVFSRNDEEDKELLKRLTDPKAGQMRYLFLRGYPDYFSSDARALVRNIATNYQSYKVTIISAEPPSSPAMRDAKDASAFTGSCLVRHDGKRSFFRFPEKEEESLFNWFTEPRAMSPETVRRFRTAYEPVRQKNDIFDHLKLSQNVSYVRGKGRKGISLPFGFDTKDKKVFSCTLDDTNAFCFLMGAAGSGKSSLLHMLISGVVTQYHPDDVELWLADFNRVGFMRYKTSRMPHLRYLLLDSSRLYCYSFLDKLTEEYERRKAIFAQHNWDNIVSIPPEEYMPIILVILDEFDVMSEAIKENEEYKIKLQDIVSKGRKFGFRIIFSTQKYTSGSSGLTQTARINLNARMAMYAPDQDEIKQTISVPKLKEEEVRLIQNMTPYHVLYRQADKTSSYRLNYIENFYVDDADLDRRDRWMAQLGQGMKRSEHFDFGNIASYVDKKCVVIDGITEERFTDKRDVFRECARQYQSGFAAQTTDKLIFPGNPCAFDKAQPLILTAEEYQNALLFCDYTGNNAKYLCDVVCSVLRSARMSNLKTEIWAPPRDICLNSRAIGGYWAGSENYDEISAVSQRLRELRGQIDAGEKVNRFIAVFNFPKLVRQMERKKTAAGGMTGGSAAGRGSALGIDLSNPFGGGGDPIEAGYKLSLQMKAAGSSAPEPTNPMDDFFYLLQWGPESGLHFLVNADSYAGLKAAGCAESVFPHVLAFRMNGADADAILDNYSRTAKRLEEGVFMYTDRKAIRMFIPYNNEDLIRHQ